MRHSYSPSCYFRTLWPTQTASSFFFHLTINWPKRPNSQRTRGCRTPCSFYPRNINWPNKRVKKSVYHFGVFMLFTTTAASAGCIIHTIFNLYSKILTLGTYSTKMPYTVGAFFKSVFRFKIFISWIFIFGSETNEHSA